MTGALLTPSHLAILVVVILLLFGAKRLPHTGRALGSGIREFTGALTGAHGEEASTPDQAGAAVRSEGAGS